MNNKKLFKGALVLFASILMAVSCSSNSNPDGDTTQKPAPDTRTEITKADLAAAFTAAWNGTGNTGLSVKSGDTVKIKIDTEDATLKINSGTGELIFVVTDIKIANNTDASKAELAKNVKALIGGDLKDKLSEKGISLGKVPVTFEATLSKEPSSATHNNSATLPQVPATVKSTHKLESGLLEGELANIKIIVNLTKSTSDSGWAN